MFLVKTPFIHFEEKLFLMIIKSMSLNRKTWCRKVLGAALDGMDVSKVLFRRSALKLNFQGI